MRSYMRVIPVFLALSIVSPPVFGSSAPGDLRLVATDTSTHAAIAPEVERAFLIDVTHDAVLFDRNGRDPIPPASMSKIYTHLMLLERIKEGRLSLEDTFTVSERAWRMKGSRTFLDIGSKVEVKNLMLGLAVQSGNDAAVAIAEGLFGTEALFAEATTRRLGELGISDTVVRNASGLPMDGHVTTVRDLALGARTIIREHAEHYHIFGEREFTWNDINQKNRNPLLGENGVDGMKTGWTSEAGYGLIASAERDGRRLVGVVAGARTPRDRARAMSALLAWGFETFTPIDPCEGFSVTLTVTGSPVESVETRPRDTCPLLVERSRDRSGRISVRAVAEQPLEAPVNAGSFGGVLFVYDGDTILAERDLVIADDARSLTFFERLRRTIGI